VEPEGTALGHACGPAVPAGCIPVTPRSKTVTLRLQHQVQDAHGEPTSTINFSRTAFPLADGNAVTDYFTQGMSFGAAPWLLHLTPPPTGPFQRASVYVALTRHRSWADVRLVAPLWDSPARRQETIGKFAKAAEEDKELVDEMRRLEGLAAQTAARYAPDVMQP